MSGVETGGQGGVSRLSDQTSCPGGTAGQGVNAGEPQRAPGHAASGSMGRMRQGGAGVGVTGRTRKGPACHAEESGSQAASNGNSWRYFRKGK